MERPITGLIRCRRPHQTLLDIFSLLEVRHRSRDDSASLGDSGVPFGDIDQEILDRIEEAFEDAPKTQRIIAKPIQENAMDPRDFGPGEC